MKTDSTKSLGSLRTQIDEIDEQLMQLIALRMDKVREIGTYKNIHGMKILNAKRKLAVSKKWLHEAEKLHLSPEFLRALYSIIHEHSVEIESGQDGQQAVT